MHMMKLRSNLLRSREFSYWKIQNLYSNQWFECSSLLQCYISDALIVSYFKIWNIDWNSPKNYRNLSRAKNSPTLTYIDDRKNINQNPFHWKLSSKGTIDWKIKIIKCLMKIVSTWLQISFNFSFFFLFCVIPYIVYYTHLPNITNCFCLVNFSKCLSILFINLFQLKKFYLSSPITEMCARERERKVFTFKSKLKSKINQTQYTWPQAMLKRNETKLAK